VRQPVVWLYRTNSDGALWDVTGNHMKQGTIASSSKKGRVAHVRFRPKVIAVAVAACLSAGNTLANPTNPVVVNGSANFTQSGNLLQVTNSPSAIINWGSFSIGAGEITRFIQQSASSAVLNRIVGQNPSSILGALQSNGRVFLINPNGITFGAGSQINVGGLVASTLNLSNEDFLAGRMRFTDGLGKSVVNQGNITTQSGGNVYLIGNAVTNNGIITSPKGDVLLAAGNSVELVNPGTPDLRVEIVAPDNQALNLGQIVADSGRIGIYAGLINHSGIINANSVQVGENGQIVLKASKNTTLEAGSSITANGPTGGKISIESGDTTLAAGAIEASGSAGRGGEISVLGNLVGVTGNARINASGDAGGGTVLIGGDFQGKDAAVRNAFRTYVGADTSIKADALTNGDGGKVIVWSDDTTRAYGSISARGGASSGNGGFVEVSGKGWLDFNASVDTRAANGLTGTLLLDPTSIYIANNLANATAFGMTGTDTTVDGSGPSLFAASGTPTNSLLLTSTLTSALASTSVVVSTASAGTSAGNIGVVDPITWNSANSLTLLAQDKIISRAITNSGSGSINMYAGWDGVSTVNPVVTAGAGKDILITASLQTGGNILLKAGNDIIVQPSLTSFAPPVIGAIGTNFSITPVVVTAGGSFTANAGNNFTLQGNTATASASTGLPIAVSDSSATINANSVNITASGVLTIAGGDFSGATAPFARADGSLAGEIFSATATSNANLTATNDISLTGNSIVIRGGNFPSFFTAARAQNNLGSGSATANAKATVAAGGGITFTAGAGGILIRGADNARALASSNNALAAVGNATVDGRTSVTAGGNVALNAGANSIIIRGGDNLFGGASDNDLGLGTVLVDSSTAVTAGSNLTITAGALTVRGGNSARASATSGSAGFNRATVNANATVLANTATITVSGPVNIQGGSSANAVTRGSDGNGRFEATVNANAKVQGTSNVTLTLTAGDLTVAGGDAAEARGTEAAGRHTLITNANAELSADGSLAVNVNSGNLTLRGGDNARVNISGSTGAINHQSSVSTNALISGGSNVTLNVSNALLVRGGNGAAIDASNETGVANGVLQTNATATAGGSLTITAGSVTVQGGNNARADIRSSGSNTGTVTTNAKLLGGNVNITVAGPLNIYAGTGAVASASASNVAGAKATAVVNADAQIRGTSGLSVAVNAGDLTIAGGDTANAAGDFVFRTNVATVNSNADLSSGGNATIAVTAGNLTVRGGDGVRSSANAQASPGAVVTSQLNAKGSIQAGGSLGLTVSGLFDVRGGNNADAVAAASFDPLSRATASADVSAVITSGGALTIGTGSLNVRGGATPNVSASGSGFTTATLINRALVSAGGLLTVQASNAADVGASPPAPSSGTLTGGGALSGSGVILKAIGMDIQGPVTAGGGTGSIDIQTATAGLTIDLGSVAPSSGTLDLSSVELGNLQAANLSFTGSPIANSGAVTTAPTTALTINSPGQTITLSAANDFQGTVALNGANVTVNDVNALTLAMSNVTGALSVTAGGAITQTGPLTVNGTATFNGAGNPVTLTQANNFLGSLILSGGGTTQITNSGALTLQNANLGNATLSAPAISIQGPVSANFYTLPVGTLTVQSGGTLSVVNDTNIGAGAVLATNGGTFNSGTISVNGLLQGSATGPISATTITVPSSGTLSLNGGSVTATSVNLAGGLLKGSGTVNGNVNNDGVVSPGNSPGLISIFGNYVQGPTGVLNIEIGGLTPITQYDQLFVSGNATLNGLLNTTLINGFLPAADTFNIIKTLGSTTGTFSSISFPALASVAANYLANGVDIFVTPGSVLSTIVNTSLLPPSERAPTGILEDKDVFPSVDENKDIFSRLQDYLICN
jgi:filamentous hemagglutinin family protein